MSGINGQMVVLDTHTLLWWASEPSRLSVPAQKALNEADRLGVAAISFWEISMLVRRERLQLDLPVAEWTKRLLNIPRIEPLAFTPTVAVMADGLQMHADPADRFIVATAIESEAPLVTKDQLLALLPFVRTVW